MAVSSIPFTAVPISGTPPNGTLLLGYGSSDTKFFIISQNTTTSAPELSALDLSQQWSKNSPLWRNLGWPNIIQEDFRAGTYDVLSKSLIVLSIARNGTGSIYGFQESSGSWAVENTFTDLLLAKSPQAFITSSNDGNQSRIIGKSDSAQIWSVPFHKNVTQILTDTSTVPVDSRVTSGNIDNILKPIRTSVDNGALVLQVFDISKRDWSPLPVGEPVPPARTGHCLISTNDANTLYLFGGQSSSDSSIFLGDLYSIDLTQGSKTWKQHIADTNTNAIVKRHNMACGISGNDVFIVWGGTDSGADDKRFGIPEIFNLATGNWTDNFIPNSKPTSSPNPGMDTPEGPPAGSEHKNGSNVGAIVGGVVGGLVVVAAAAFLLLRNRRSNKSINTRSLGMKSDNTQSMIGSGDYASIPSRTDGSPYPVQPYYANAIPPLENIAQSHMQNQQYAPAMPSRPIDLSPPSFSQPPRIQSPFEEESEYNHQLPLLNSTSLAPPQHPSVSQITAQYHDRNMEDEQINVTSRSTEPASVDLIPITASEAGEGSDISRSNSLVSGTDGPSKASLAHNKSRASGPDNEKELYEQEESRRDSSESLEYLDIS
ncbi:hypothetical protein BGZ76_002736 [Entomortierella beljakovae]|nr:hypothetical protein BGZ76_002736 [Entomortierella beljakovae]